MIKNIFILIFLLSAVFICSDNLSAQLKESTFDDKDRFGTGPQMDGHDFIVNSFVKNPFILSHLKTNLGIATSIETEIPVLTTDSTSGKIKINGSISYVSGLFEFQYAVKDWAAIWLNFSAIARLGTNVPSIFISGITANTSFETGMMFKIVEYEKMMLSSGISISNSGSTVISIFPYLQSLQDSTSNTKLLNNYNPLTGSLDVRLAWSPGKRWSILSYAEGGYGETIGQEAEDTYNSSVGASVNYNMSVNSKIPLSFGTGFRFNSNSPTLDNVKQWTQAYLLQIAYSGKRDFLLSFEANYLRIPTKTNDITLNLTSYGINWTYYF